VADLTKAHLGAMRFNSHGRIHYPAPSSLDGTGEGRDDASYLFAGEATLPPPSACGARHVLLRRFAGVGVGRFGLPRWRTIDRRGNISLGDGLRLTAEAVCRQVPGPVRFPFAFVGPGRRIARLIAGSVRLRSRSRLVAAAFARCVSLLDIDRARLEGSIVAIAFPG
jgi:hypothetical protein